MADLQGYLTLQQIDRLLNSIENPRDKVLIRLMSRTGRRVTEVVGRKAYIHRNATQNIEVEYPEVPGIRPMDINWDEGLIAFPIIKKKNPMRKLKPVDEKTLIMLHDYITSKGVKDDERIFPITRYRVFQIMRKYCKAAAINFVGVKLPHPHHLRHSFAIHVLKASKDPSDIKKLQMALEHSNINITSGYLQFDQKELRGMVERAFQEPGDSP